MMFVVGSNPRSRLVTLPKYNKKKFTLPELQKHFEKVIGCKLDKRNFVKSLKNRKLVRQVMGLKETSRRPARLYTYVPGDFSIIIFDDICFQGESK